MDQATGPTLFSYVSALDDEVQKYLKRVYPYFKRTYSYALKQVIMRIPARPADTCKEISITMKILVAPSFLIPTSPNHLMSSSLRLNLPTIIISKQVMEVWRMMIYFTRDRTYLSDHQLLKQKPTLFQVSNLITTQSPSPFQATLSCRRQPLCKPGHSKLFDIRGRNITLLNPENPAKVSVKPQDPKAPGQAEMPVS